MAVLLSDTIILNIGMAVISFMALHEMYEAVGLMKYPPLKILGLAASFAFTFAYSFDNKILMPVIFLHTGAFCFIHEENSKLELQDISKMFFLTIFICFLWYILFS